MHTHTLHIHMHILSHTESFYFSALVIVQCVFAHTDKTQVHSVFKFGEKAEPLYIFFHCCGMCGTSIDEFMEGIDCPNLSGRTPLLLTCSSDLDHFKEEKNCVMEFSRYIKFVSKKLTLDMQSEYLLLIKFTISEIRKLFPIENHVFFRHLLQLMIRHRGLDYVKREEYFMSRLRTYEDLHEFLEQQLCSWIYTEPLRDAIECLGTDTSALTYYSSYEKKVAHFLKRSCFERFGYVHTDVVQHYREIVCNVSPRTIRLSELELFEERLRRLLEVHFLMPRCDSEMIVKNESIVFRSVHDSKERFITKSKLTQLGFKTAVKSPCIPSLEVRVITAKEAVLSIFRQCWWVS